MSDTNVHNTYPKGFAVFNLFGGSKFAVRVDDIISVLEIKRDRTSVLTREPSAFGVNMAFDDVMSEIGRAQR